MNTTSPKNRRFEKTRQGIIDAAREIARTEGIDALSMRTLAEKVDYSASALYKYFNNKEEIIEALRLEGWNEMQSIFMRRLGGDFNQVERLMEASMAYMDMSNQSPELYELMFNSTVGAPDDLAATEKDPRFMVLTDMIREAVESGEFTLPGDMTVLEYRYLAWFIMHGICMLKISMYRNCVSQFDPMSREIVKKFIRFGVIQTGNK
jgi:AcrR family transcriptional regulator